VKGGKRGHFGELKKKHPLSGRQKIDLSSEDFEWVTQDRPEEIYWRRETSASRTRTGGEGGKACGLSNDEQGSADRS